MLRRANPFVLLMFAAVGCDRAPAHVPVGWHFVESEQMGIREKVVCGDPRRWYIPESNGSGAAWLDYDGDGDMDLFVGNGCNTKYAGARPEIVRDTSSYLYRNDFSGVFVNIAKEAGITTTAWVNGVATGDVDNDGDPDLYLACFGGGVFYKNVNGKFNDVTAVAGLTDSKWGASAAFGDADNDGDLDLYVANYCEFNYNHPPKDGARNVIGGVEVAWGPEHENPGINVGAPDAFFINDGNGKFKEALREAGLELAKPLCSYSVVFSDIDNDGKQDILVSNDGQPCNLFHNVGNGKFKEEGEARGFAFAENGKVTSAMGLAVEDFDFDGDFDVFRTNFETEANCLHVNDGKGYFTDRAAEFGLAAPSVEWLGWGCAFYDSDNDGNYEIVVANGHVYPQSQLIGMHPFLQPVQFYEIDGAAAKNGKFTYRDATKEANLYNTIPLSAARGVAVGDPDNDGMPDLAIVNIDAPVQFLKNHRAPAGDWVSVRLIGAVSNRDGYGAKITVRAGGKSRVREMRTSQGLYSSHDPRLHFGLGNIDNIDSIEVAWPSGIVQKLEKVHPNQFITIREEK